MRSLAAVARAQPGHESAYVVDVICRWIERERELAP
jgi:hypothetical protein